MTNLSFPVFLFKFPTVEFSVVTCGIGKPSLNIKFIIHKQSQLQKPYPEREGRERREEMGGERERERGGWGVAFLKTLLLSNLW